MGPRTAFLCALLAGLLLLTACGGKDKKKDEAGASGAAATATRAATEAARQATAAGTEAVRQATATAAAAQSERIIAADCLKGVKSYRYEGKVQLKLPAGATAGPLPGVELSDVSFSGAFVAPDREQFKIDLGGSTAFETVTIGTESWFKAGPTGWVKSTSGGVTFSPDTFCRSNLREIQSAGVRPSRERVAGADALKYEFDKKAIVRLNSLFGTGGALPDLPDNTRLTVWVTEKERWPLRVTLTGDRAGADPYAIKFEFNVTELNKDDVKIEAPR